MNILVCLAKGFAWIWGIAVVVSLFIYLNVLLQKEITRLLKLEHSVDAWMIESGIIIFWCLTTVSVGVGLVFCGILK